MNINTFRVAVILLLKAFLASDPRADRHEGAEGAPALHHSLGNLRHQLAAPEAYPPGAEAAEEEAGGHAHAHTHDEAHLDAVEAGGPLGSSGWGDGGHCDQVLQEIFSRRFTLLTHRIVGRHACIIYYLKL